MDKDKALKIRDLLGKVMGMVGDEFGVVPTIRKGTYGKSNYTVTVEFSEVNQAGEVQTKEVIDFKHRAHSYGLQPDDLNKKFLIGNREVILIGSNRRSYKYPILCKCVKSGKLFKYAAVSIRRILHPGAVVNPSVTNQILPPAQLTINQFFPPPDDGFDNQHED